MTNVESGLLDYSFHNLLAVRFTNRSEGLSSFFFQEDVSCFLTHHYSLRVVIMCIEVKDFIPLYPMSKPLIFLKLNKLSYKELVALLSCC